MLQEEPLPPNSVFGRNVSNLIFPPCFTGGDLCVVGGLWNSQSAIRKVDYACASHLNLDFLTLAKHGSHKRTQPPQLPLCLLILFPHSPTLWQRRWRSSVISSSLSSFEFHTVSVTSPYKLSIIVVYRPPGLLGRFLDEMDILLSSSSSPDPPG